MPTISLLDCKKVLNGLPCGDRFDCPWVWFDSVDQESKLMVLLILVACFVH